MKKLFFFKSSSSNGTSNPGSPPLSDNQNHRECESNSLTEKNSPSCSGLATNHRNLGFGEKSPTSSSSLRRSRSMSSASVLNFGREQTGDCKANNRSGQLFTEMNGTPNKCSSKYATRRSSTPERRTKVKHFDAGALQNFDEVEKPASSVSSKSHCSNSSINVLDRFIDGEQQHERYQSKNFPSQGKLPPRFQHTAPTSPTKTSSSKPWAPRERKNSSSKSWYDAEYGHYSPRRLARNVIEKLTQSYAQPNMSSNEFGRDGPITIEDIYSASLDKCCDVNVDAPSLTSHNMEDRGGPFFGSHYQNMFTNSCRNIGSVNEDEVEDQELYQKSKDAEERVLQYSEEFEQRSFFPAHEFDVPSLIGTVRKLAEDRLNLAIEVSGLIKARVHDRKFAKQDLRLVKDELECRTIRLEKEKNELQTALEKELDRRSSEWSSKLGKYRSEEQRLRERVRELAEQNVSLQKEVSSVVEREADSRSIVSITENQLRDLESRNGELNEENKALKHELLESKKNLESLESQYTCIKRNFEGKDKECKEQQKSISRMIKTCGEQEKTIEALRESLDEETGKHDSSDNYDKQLRKLKMEQTRLTGSELNLRREMESCRAEISSLRYENINLLKRLKVNGEDAGASSIRLDEEIRARVNFLQKQALPLLSESADFCFVLVERIKEKEGKQDDRHGNGLERQFLIEAEIKAQNLKRTAESMARSLHAVSSSMQEKWDDGAKDDPPCRTTLEDELKYRLKAETMLSSLLRDALYSKEMEIELLQADMAAAARGNDILRCEVQNALDNVSCISHKLKCSELELLKKEESIYQLQGELQSCAKELTLMKGILPKVSDERDMMWEQVKQYNEKNMLLNSELTSLRKRIEALDEDILLKDGQITILKDTINSGPFDLLSPDAQDFLLK